MIVEVFVLVYVFGMCALGFYFVGRVFADMLGVYPL